jgi:SAM-dependent methyltransferase
MARWDDGYVTDVVYTSNFYRECTPSWLATACLLLGHRPPDLTRPFRYADFGCGHGFTALTVAATSPRAEVWGFDFNPAHVESARNLAAAAGLTNAHFEEASFGDLAATSPEAMPPFDFIVSHGVLSWISRENRQHLLDLLGRRLRPGGLAYVSYNVSTGWSGMAPLRGLMRMLAEANPDRTDIVATAVLDYVDQLKASGALFFQANPGIEARLAEIRRQDPRYIAHEFLNQEWYPADFAEVAKAMAERKCSYIGSATLAENIDVVAVPNAVQPLMASARDPLLRETLRDFGSGQGFRRDIYRRGMAPMPAAEHQIVIDDLTIGWTGQAAGDKVTIATPIGSLTGRDEIYRPLLGMLEAGPVSVRQARTTQSFAGPRLLDLLQAVALLIGSGFANPVLPGGISEDARQSAERLNLAIAALNARGGDLPRVVSPLMGAAINVDLLVSLLVGELLKGHPPEVEALTTLILAHLTHGGRTVQRDGQPISDPVQARSIVADVLRTGLEQRGPLLREWGVLK